MRLAVALFCFSIVGLIGCGLVFAGYPVTVNKGNVIYGLDFDAGDLSFVAGNFDWVDMDFNGSRSDFFIDYYGHASDLKVANPSLTILGYKDLPYMKVVYDDWSEVVSHPEWFMKTVSGDFIYSSYWSAYLMNVSSAGYQQHWIDYVSAKLAQGTGVVFDGVFVDDVWNTLDAYSTGWNGTVPAGDFNAWHDNVEAFLTHLKADLGSVIVLVNSDEFASDDYISLVDGQMIEGFIHGDWYGDDTWYNGTAWSSNLARKVALDKVVWCHSGSQNDAGRLASILSYCYEEFVSNADLETSIFSFNGWYSVDSSQGYYSVMDSYLGGVSPTSTVVPPAVLPTYVGGSESGGSGFGFGNSFLNLFMWICFLVAAVIVVFGFFSRRGFSDWLGLGD